MKRKKKFTSFIGLILTVGILLCSLASCDLVLDPPEDGTVAADIGNPSERSSEKSSETNVSGETKPQKEYCTATVDEDFYGKYVVIQLFPQYDDAEYTVEDFAYIGCISVYEIEYAKQYNDGMRRMRLTLDVDSKENVLNVIKVLERREDIYRAEPDYCAYLD